MTTHAAAYESLSSRTNAGSSVRPDQSFADRVVDVPVIGSDFYLLPQPQIPLSGYNELPVTSIDVIEFGDTNLRTRAWGGEVLTDQATVLAAGAPFLQRNDFAASSVNTGRLAPQVLIDYGALTRPANPLTVNAVIQYAYKNSTYQGLTHFCEFEEFPPDSVADGSGALQSLLAQFTTGKANYQVGINGSGTAIVVNSCGFAAVAPEGAVYIRPEDVGTASDQIPASIFDNAASKFRAHPSVFYPAGKTPYVRGLTRQAIDVNAIDAAGSNVNDAPLAIYTVDTAPTFSDWVVSVDGQVQIVRLLHPAGSDYRRPRDIYNALWVPILTGGSNTANAVAFGQVVGQTDAVAFRWAYCDYLRCLPLAGTNVNQTGQG